MPNTPFADSLVALSEDPTRRAIQIALAAVDSEFTAGNTSQALVEAYEALQAALAP